MVSGRASSATVRVSGLPSNAASQASSNADAPPPVEMTTPSLSSARARFFAFRLAKRGLSVLSEDLRNGFAEFVLKLDIEVDHLPTEAICENPAGRGFACPTEANQGNTAIRGHGRVVLRTLLMGSTSICDHYSTR